MTPVKWVYFDRVKYLLALFLLMSALQPLQLQACDMEESPEAGHHSTLMENSDHDCCTHEDDSAIDGCLKPVFCGSCTVALTLLQPDPDSSNLELGLRFTILDESGPTPPHYHPPFRPPIA